VKGLAFKAMRTGFHIGSLVAPEATGRAALALFRKPFDPMGPSPRKAQVIAAGRAQFAAAESHRIVFGGGDVQAYRFRPAAEADRGETVAVVHGWANQAFFMQAYVEGLVGAGFTVIAFDLPAHGDSSGTSTDPFDGARALQAVAKALGPLDAVLAYSFGGAVTAVAVEGAAPLTGSLAVKRIALVAPPNAISDVTRRFGAMAGLKAPGQAAFERQLARRGGRPVESLEVGAMIGRARLPLLVVHARDDREIPFADSERLAAKADARLVALDGLGHRRILYAPEAITAVTDFLTEKVAEPAAV
jgi:pimeloyl-ACP methyl ester carboxylesterase